MGEIAVAVDCSGSVNGRQLRLFEGKIRSIPEGQRPERVYDLYFDAIAQKVENKLALLGTLSMAWSGSSP